MSEITPEELVEEIEYEVDDSDVILTPVDPTLSIPGEAADAKAVGDAFRALGPQVKVNTKTADASGNISVYATDIPMSDAIGAQTVSQAITSSNNRTAGDILYESGETDTIADVVDSFMDTVEAGVTDGEIDAIFSDWED